MYAAIDTPGPFGCRVRLTCGDSLLRVYLGFTPGGVNPRERGRERERERERDLYICVYVIYPYRYIHAYILPGVQYGGSTSRLRSF